MNKLEKHILEELKKHIKNRLSIHGTHGYEHTLRVLKTCKFLGGKMDADMMVLLPAAILHDIARETENHAKEGAVLAGSILAKYNLSNEKIGAICHAIESHSFSGRKKPQSLEAKILSDADKLDAMGAIGIYRVSSYSGENMRSLDEAINHFHDKLLHLKDFIYTDEALKLAVARHKFMLNFLNELREELDLRR